MHSATLVVEHYLSGCRVDTFLAKHFRSYTPWRMHRMVRAGLVMVQGTVAAPDRRVFTDETVSINLLEPPDNLMPAEEISFGIVFEDEWLLIVNKPAGLIIHPTGQNPSGTLTNAVQFYLDQKSSFPGQFKPGIVHRLDRDTSGVVALAKDHFVPQIAVDAISAGTDFQIVHRARRWCGQVGFRNDRSANRPSAQRGECPDDVSGGRR